jgi:exodeoxyribonuclease VII large subunit
VAAELLVPERGDLVARLRTLQQGLQAQHLRRLRDAMQRADRAALRLNALRPQARLQQLRARQQVAMQRLASTFRAQDERRRARLRHAEAVLRAMAPRRRLIVLRERVATLQPRPLAAIARHLQRDALRLRGLARSLEAVSPLATVARGYAILQHEDGRVVRAVGDAEAGDRLDARLADGTLRVRVEGAGSS